MTEKPDYAPGSIACIAFDAGAIWKQNEIIKLFENVKNEPQRKQENWLHKVARVAFADAAIKLIRSENK